MLEQDQVDIIKGAVKDFFEKMTIPASSIEASLTSEKDAVDIDVKLEEPQILIGQQGQTLFEIQRLLRTILNKKLQNTFYFNLDINDYKRKKVEYLKNLAKELADQAALAGEEKTLPPMSAYERRIIHAELSQRTDVVTESWGEDFERHIIIKPK